MAERPPAVVFACGALAGVCAAGAAAYVISRHSSGKDGLSKEARAVTQSSDQESSPKVEQTVPATIDKLEDSLADNAVDEHRSPVLAHTAEPDADDPLDKPDDAPEGCVGVSSEQAGKASSCAGCPNQKACASGEAKKPDPAVSDVAERLKDVKRKILVLSGKGGVGKSTISAQLAFGFAARNNDVGLLDVDICGPSIPRMLFGPGFSQDVHQSNEGWSPVYVPGNDHLAVMSIGFLLPNQDDPVIWRGPRKNALIRQFLTDTNWGPLEALLVDTPPGTSDEHLSIVQYLQESSMDGAVVVTTPQEVSLSDVRKEINFCRKIKLPVIGVIENMSGFVCPKCSHEEHIFAPSTGGAEAMCAAMGVPFLGRVPLDGRVAKAGDAGQSLQLIPDGPVAQCISNVIDAILKQTDKS